jgi:hypothetical protein
MSEWSALQAVAAPDSHHRPSAAPVAAHVVAASQPHEALGPQNLHRMFGREEQDGGNDSASCSSKTRPRLFFLCKGTRGTGHTIALLPSRLCQAGAGQVGRCAQRVTWPNRRRMAACRRSASSAVTSSPITTTPGRTARGLVLRKTARKRCLRPTTQGSAEPASSSGDLQAATGQLMRCPRAGTVHLPPPPPQHPPHRHPRPPRLRPPPFPAPAAPPSTAEESARGGLGGRGCARCGVGDGSRWSH